MIKKLKNKLFLYFSNFHSSENPPTLYQVINEEQGVYLLVKNFYYIMEHDPKAKQCLITHELVDGKIPDPVKKKLFMFLCGWFGGPNLYVEAYGHPRMRARHMHVKITQIEKDQWLYCMKKALKMHTPKIPRKHWFRFEGSFRALAGRIQNS